MNNSVILGGAKSSDISPESHIPSKVNPDTLFTFSSKIDYIIKPLEQKLLSPRYCVEDINYLKINQLKTAAIPMKCFCDINLHRLNEHISFYGYYGLAFSKEWGMRKHIQPIQYINKESPLCKELSKLLKTALKNKNSVTPELNSLRSFLLHELMYWKPYQGRTKNRVTNKNEIRCFSDECEWRFIPDVKKEGFDQAIFDQEVINSSFFSKMSEAMDGLETISLDFEYDDLKYIIVKSKSDFDIIYDHVLSLDLDKKARYELISKILIWDYSKGDF